MKKRKYIESHWLVFGLKGVVALLAGLCMVMTTKSDTHYLIQIVGWTLFGLALVEIGNLIYRKIRQHDWGLSLVIAFVELATSIALLYTVNPDTVVSNEIVAVRIPILAGYVLLASALNIVVAFKSMDDPTPRFMWVVSGMIGCILGFIILADNGLSETTHIRVVGTYLMVKGLTDLFYGIYSRGEIQEVKEEKLAAKAERAKTKAAKLGSKSKSKKGAKK